MKIKKLLSLSVLELIRFKSTTIFLVLNLTLGLMGFFLLQVFEQSLNLQSAEQAQVILGGDISVSARRAFTQAERKAWEAQFSFNKSSQFYSLFSMLRSSNDSRLVNVGIFDNQFPLYGNFKLSDLPFLSDEPRVWVDPEVQEILNLKLNDFVEIGEKKFKFSGAILEDPSRLFRSAGFAPRVLIHQKYLNAASLIQPGSTFSEYWSYQTANDINLIDVKTKLDTLITDPIVRINTTVNNSDDSNRVLRYFTDYLGLVALVALGLCFLCGSYLLQWAFLSKKQTIAIYKTLGLTDLKIIFIYLFQNIIISVLASGLGLFFVRLILPLAQNILTNKFKLALILVLSPQAMLVTCIIAVLGPMLIVVPQIMQIIQLRPLMLFQNIETAFKKNYYYWAWLFVSVCLFWVVAAWQSNSYKIAAVFTAALVGLIILFHFINLGFLFVLEKNVYHFSWLTQYSIKGLTRKKSSTSLVFTTMSLATLVLSLLPHVKTSIINEIQPQNTSQVPSLFMFDIQPEQVQPLQKKAQQILGQTLPMSPLVRARILKINNENYEKVNLAGGPQTREAGEEARSRNRGINLTYRSYLQDSEETVSGSLQNEYIKSEKLPQISIEKSYAERVNIKINDIILFDVQGIEVSAEVGSLRQVRWTSFQPNFFILFPTGVLEEAPQIFLASVANAKNEKIKFFQKEISNTFKNVSIIDVVKTVENSMKYINQMALALQFMAWLAVGVGLFVFIVLVNTQIKERLQEMNLLQILGSSHQQVLKIIYTQFIVLIATSVLFGVTLGLALAFIIITFFFDIKTTYDFYYLVLLALVMLPICSMALYLGLKPLKKLNPMDLIRL